jgi:hypothetical protein
MKNRRNVSILMALILIMCLFTVTQIKVQAVSSNSEYEYSENQDGTVTITKYLSKNSIVNIPSSIEGKRVAKIGEKSFMYTNIENVVIPNTVTSIDSWAFLNCNYITSINIPESVQVIGDYAFASCFGLQSVTISPEIQKIGENAFMETPWYKEYFREFSKVGTYSGGVYSAEKNGKYGFIDLNRKVMLPFEYDAVLTGTSDIYEVKKGGEWFCLDKSFNPVKANNIGEIYNELYLNLYTSNITPVERARSTETRYSDWYGNAGKKADLIDYKGNLSIVYESVNSKNLYIARFDENYKLRDTLTITKELPLFGTAACDNKGNYYVLYGTSVAETEKDKTNVVIVKYNNNGKKLGEASYISGKMSFLGTKEPFAFANASMAISNNIIAAHFGRVMFKAGDGLNHQSSTVVYADIDSMKPVSLPIPYASHSFDQQIIATTDGGFALVDKGDAYPRGFELSKISEGRSDSFEAFHFAETSTYQNTRAHLGGIAENSYAYILSGSAVKTLTYDPIPGDKLMAKDVFVQSIKKNFMYHSNNSDKLLSKAETRIPSGEAGQTGLNLSGQSYFLPNNVVDYGVVWLTEYQADEAALNPKVVGIDNDFSVILWEKYKGGKFIDTYYAIVNYAGAIVKEPAVIPKARLCEDERPLYSDGKIIWSVTSTASSEALNTISIYKLSFSASTPDQLYSNCYSVVLKAQRTGLQSDINLARKAQNALIGTEAEWAAGEFSRQIDQLQQPILVNICEAIDKIQAQAKSDTINQIDINSAKRFIPVDLDPYWRNSYSSAIDLVQQQLMKKTKDAYDKAVKSGLKSDIDEVNALVSNLSKSDDSSIREWAKSFSL